MKDALREMQDWEELKCLGEKYAKDSDTEGENNDAENLSRAPANANQDQKELLLELTMAMDIIKERHPLYEKSMSEVIPLLGRLNWDKFDEVHDEITDKHKEQQIILQGSYLPPSVMIRKTTM